MEGVPEETIQEIAAWNSTSGHKQVDMAWITSQTMIVILRSRQSTS